MAQTPPVVPAGDRYQTHLFTSTVIGLFITCCFIFSTLYGLNHYYGIGEDQAIENKIAEMEGRAARNIQDESFLGIDPQGSLLDTVFGIGGLVVDDLLETFSILNPFGMLLKPYIIKISLEHDVYDLYEALNLFILRPLGWIFTVVLIEFVFNYIRGRST